MPTIISRAGFALGAIGIFCAPAVRADDFRPTQSLLESGLFLSQLEADAVYARLDAPRTGAGKPAPGSTAYWESGAVGLGQSERNGRLGWSGDATQMRVGADREIRDGVVAGASASASIGGVGSADLTGRVMAGHTDLYARFDGDGVFVKALAGASSFSFGDLRRGGNWGSASGMALRAGGQVGGMVEIRGVKVSPTLALTATGHSLGGYRESGAAAAVFQARKAGAATATVRLSGTRAVRIDPAHTVDLSGFVAADEVVAYRDAALKVSASGVAETIPTAGAPSGRGLFGGVGVATALAEGVSVKLDYDYGRRDGVATRSGRARLGVSF